MFQTHPPFAERMQANMSFMAQHPHASDKEDEVTQASPVMRAPTEIDLSIPFVPFAEQQKSRLFSDFGQLRVGTPVSDTLRGH